MDTLRMQADWAISAIEELQQSKNQGPMCCSPYTVCFNRIHGYVAFYKSHILIFGTFLNQPGQGKTKVQQSFSFTSLVVWC